jgi:hypothetical protein
MDYFMSDNCIRFGYSHHHLGWPSGVRGSLFVALLLVIVLRENVRAVKPTIFQAFPGSVLYVFVFLRPPSYLHKGYRGPCRMYDTCGTVLSQI